MHVVDCGSGWSRWQTFSKHSDGLIRIDKTTRLPAVAEVIAAIVPGGESPPEVAAWFTALAKCARESGEHCQTLDPGACPN